jgi:restriction endonuclease
MTLPQGFKSMPVKKKEPNELYIKISHEEGAFVKLLNQEIEELQRSMKEDEQERNDKTTNCGN